MAKDEDVFVERVDAVLRRFFAQNGEPMPDATAIRGVGTRLWALVRQRGLPRPLAAHERGEPGGITDEEWAPLVGSVVDTAAPPLLVEAVRQLVKACLYPEFKTCRDSFREVRPDGTCRRQELPRALRRVSGTHCVDCPHWVALEAAHHERFLARSWRAGPAPFLAHRDVFLPEDFRALRQWLHAAARRGGPAV